MGLRGSTVLDCTSLTYNEFCLIKTFLLFFYLELMALVEFTDVCVFYTVLEYSTKKKKDKLYYCIGRHNKRKVIYTSYNLLEAVK